MEKFHWTWYWIILAIIMFITILYLCVKFDLVGDIIEAIADAITGD